MSNIEQKLVVKEAHLPWKENISLESFVDGLIDEIEGSEYQIYETLLGNCNGHKVPVPFILDNVAVPAYTSLFNIADNYAKSSDTIDALIENLDCSHNEAIKRVLFTFIKKNGVDLSAEVPLRDLAIELLSCMCMARNLYTTSKAPDDAALATGCNRAKKSEVSNGNANEIASKIRDILPTWIKLVVTYTTGTVVSRVSDAIDNYIADEKMEIDDLATYFSSEEIAEYLENGINEVTNDYLKSFEEDEEDSFEYSKGSLSELYKQQATEAVKVYLESLIAIEIAGSELIGKKPSWLTAVVRGGSVGAATALLGPVGCLGSIAANYMLKNKDSEKDAAETFDNAVNESIKLYDLMIDKLNDLTEGLLSDYFLEVVKNLEESGESEFEELMELLETIQEQIKEAESTNEDNGDGDSVFRDDLLNVLMGFVSSDYWVLDNIPEKKLQNVRRYPVDPTDEILAVIDTTVFGSAKCGMAFGLKGLYWKNDWETKTNRNFVAWGELCKSSKKIRGLKDNMSLLPGGVFNLSGSSVKAHDLTKLIQECIAAISG